MADITTKFLKQTAVYWGAPVSNGYGAFSYEDGPVEIACRWTDSTQVVTDSKGNSIVCKSVVMVGQDLEEQGMLYLGTIADLGADRGDNPETITGTWRIMRFDKIPTIKGKTFLRVAYI
jgi:hypothetical protein